MRVGEREKRSKIYAKGGQGIAMNNDTEHQKLTESKIEETKHVQEKKQIDKILHSIVRQRLFGSLLEEENQLSMESAYNIDSIHRSQFKSISRTGQSRTRQTMDYDISSRRPSLSLHYTLDVSRSCQGRHEEQFLRTKPKKRNFSQKLPHLLKKQNEKLMMLNAKGLAYHPKKLQVNEKLFSETFKKWVGTVSSNQLIYELKVTRQNIINRYKSVVNGKILERFFHFFAFPQAFGLRQFSNLIENAANSNIKFIYFWVFSILDENNNGVITAPDLFQFIQRFPTENEYVEKEIYDIERYLQRMEKNKPKEEKESEVLVEEMLVMNRNLKIEELKVLLKQSNKEMIDVDCVKNTCYHQTVLSLQHDPLERIKKNQIENNQILTKKYKEEAMEAKKRLKNLAGLRLRDFYAIYNSKRPRIFCYLLNLLAGVKASQFQ